MSQVTTLFLAALEELIVFVGRGAMSLFWLCITIAFLLGLIGCGSVWLVGYLYHKVISL